MNIDVEYLEEAQSYIDAMPDKARKKLFYNISLVSMGVVDSGFSKNWANQGYGSSGPNMRATSQIAFVLGQNTVFDCSGNARI